MKKILLLLLITFLTCSCSYTELNDLAIASAIGIDYNDENFTLTAQILDVQNNDSGLTKQSAVIYESTGKTISEAVNNMYVRYPKNIYFGHLELGIISENAVNKKLDNIFDYFIRFPEARTSGFVLISKDKTAKEILNPKNEKKGSFPTEDIKSVLMNATEKNGTIKQITLEEFLSDYLKPGIVPVVPLINIEEKGNTSSSTKIEGLIPIYHKQLLTKLTNEQGIAYNTIFNNYKEVNINPIYKGQYIGITVFNPKSKVKVTLKNNQIYVNINIKIESRISEIRQKEDLTKIKNQKEIKKQVTKELYKNVNSLINYCKENNTDLLGIENEIYKNYFKEYKYYKNKNLYNNANIKINIKNDFYRHGNINKGAL